MTQSNMFRDDFSSNLSLIWHVVIMDTNTAQTQSGIVQCKKPMSIIEVNNKFFAPRDYTVIDEVALFKIEQRN